jgi:hypothetical protein
MLRFTIRDALWLTVVVAMGVDNGDRDYSGRRARDTLLTAAPGR